MQYAIRPSVSSNKKFDRNTVIKTVADIVGPDHPVDLKNYDLVILVTVVQVSFPLSCRPVQSWTSLMPM